MRNGWSLSGAASLRPVGGVPRGVERLLREWLSDPSAAPLTVETSGSTGAPKAVVLSSEALRASASAGVSRLGGPGQWVLALPVQHVAGLQVICRSILAGTSPVVLGDHLDLTSATAALTVGRRYLAAVPTQLYRWLASTSDMTALSGYDAVLLGGAAARPNLVDQVRRRGVRVVTTYGMTETCGGCVYDGVALDGVEVALGAGGEIRVAGPVLFDGYVDEPELTANVLRDGWLQTPDLGRFGADGRLEVIGRADDVVVTGGVNVALPIVEQRLAQLPGLADCAVMAVPDNEWGALVVAVVAEPDGAAVDLDLDTVRDFVAETLPRTWAPRALARVEQIPLLSTGKVDRQRLHGLLDSSDLARVTQPTAGRTNPGAP